MLSLYTMVALDVARERAAEARAAAEKHRVAELRAAELRAHARPARPSRVRLASASVLRWVSDRADGVSDAACNAAARVEGRAA
jgi:hypothetical protein